MNFIGMVFIAAQVTIHHPLDGCPVKIRPCQRTIIEKDLAHVIAQLVSIPDTEMEWLVPSKPDPLQVKRCKRVIDTPHPLGHAHVISVFCFKEKLEVQVRQRAVEPARTAIGSNFRQRGTALPDEPSPGLSVYGDSVRTGSAVRSLHHIVI